MIVAVAMLCGLMIGVMSTLVAQNIRAMLARTRAEIDKLDREIATLRAGPPREVTLGYEVLRDGKDMVLVWKRDGVKVEEYYMTDAAAAQLVSAIVAKFTA